MLFGAGIGGKSRIRLGPIRRESPCRSWENGVSADVKDH